ncbi:hypothetical protein KFK09_012781 [Dendrobium nobile]|uniref:Uncharacterized protein n=1 Tax=Dendrobium nobile TaxID=94219 RepID=A0A8T3BKA3_DENNO|nr:hypothetical protein KFK09_012781 [Dendrobium nobile]
MSAAVTAGKSPNTNRPAPRISFLSSAPLSPFGRSPVASARIELLGRRRRTLSDRRPPTGRLSLDQPLVSLAAVDLAPDLTPPATLGSVKSTLVESQHHWSCIQELINTKLISSGLMKRLRRLMMILYELETVGSPLARDHLQVRPIFLSHTWSEVVGGRQKGRVYGLGAQGYAIEGSSSTSAFHDLSGAEESVSERVAALTREIEEMRKVQNEMQAELQSYRVQRRQEEEQRRTSQDSEDTPED